MKPVYLAAIAAQTAMPASVRALFALDQGGRGMSQGRMPMQPKNLRGGNMSTRLPRRVPLIRETLGAQPATFQCFRKPQ